MLLKEIIGYSMQAEIDPKIVQKIVDRGASWFNQYTRPGTPPVAAVEEWMGDQPWNDMKEMWRGLSSHDKTSVAKDIVSRARSTPRKAVYTH